MNVAVVRMRVAACVVDILVFTGLMFLAFGIVGAVLDV